MTCGGCGAQVLAGDRFCPQCGRPTTVTEQSAPAPPPLSAAAGGILDDLGGRLHRFAGTERLEGFSLGTMFSEVFKRRGVDELDEYFLVGTRRTTPPLAAVETGWPKPWFFARVLLFVVVVYVGFSLGVNQFRNLNLVPGLIMMGSLAAPLATVFLFFELNTPRNVAFHEVLMLVCFGGVVSLFVSLLGFDFHALDALGASQAGIIEEIGKLLAVVLIVRNRRYPYTLNGLLFGAAVGAGFAIFESAGYAFNALLRERSLEAATHVIHLRAFLSPFGHVAWTAIAAGALWRIKGARRFNARMFVDPRFLKPFCIPVILHMLWNAPLPSPFYVRHLVIGVVGWFVVFGFVQDGLRQIRAAQADAATPAEGAAAAPGAPEVVTP